MQVKILFFGILSDKTGTASVTVNEVADLNELKQKINSVYPSIKGHPYLTAVNQEIIIGNCELRDGDEVALMPPFAGG